MPRADLPAFPPVPLPAWHARLLSLAQPAVRDLAFLLTAPTAWAASANLDPGRLLGPEGWPRLLELDAEPAELDEWLLAHPSGRLGRYAEVLLGYWFAHAPHAELVARNLAVRDAAHRTHGEFDFLVRLDGEPLHVELASKFYLMMGELPDSLIGASLRDAWRLKAARLERQLALARHPLAAPLLPAGFAKAKSVARVTGWLFARDGLALPAPLNPDAPRGWFAPLAARWPRRAEGGRWLWLPRLQWLAPARVPLDATGDEESLRARLAAIDRPQLVAELVPAGDGAAVEVARGFVLPPGWPPPEALALLRARMLPEPAWQDGR
ncbi:hypothetical protein EV683_103178 [Crenobacter luteus]|uniref:DUF1853 family protein n=1 Tax=Crenobacter luteus TaxID=1452487 RepID=UPI0010E2207A|nr:DUF1853 family protein [Crenobacter luteus]TCP14912.1 hypothetical protein EV683_103178 [Crenobacter luteus]